MGKSIEHPNLGTDFDVCRKLWGSKNYVSINVPALESGISILGKRKLDKNGELAHLLRAVTCLDLTTLNADDTPSNVERLCYKALHPIKPDLLLNLGIEAKEFHTGAVCVYPARIKDCAKTFKCLNADIPIASVAAGFPSGQYHMETRLSEIECCVRDGAREIDVVISRDLVLQGDWEELYEQVKQMKEACGPEASLKTIIAAGELGSYSNIYKASVACMAAGADFIKTSTGKESVNATLPIGFVMTRAIRDYLFETGYEVGFKPAGGIRTSKDVLMWQSLMKMELGRKWLFPDLFRIGASSLLGDIEQSLYQAVYGCYAPKHIFPF
ncbi:deoxyribose-phosphate aldolase [Parasteatoda tepidariorum]|uniref:deoxyribose-phosphate aldolase n=1 Tax=Parasteatoda tepidariorum TaxID=114398 RepID=UPI00077F9293|nr:deoxyribose-phosphate aldolase [Parasteatoda tepidariorum]